MATYSKFSTLLNGVQRTVDLSQSANVLGVANMQLIGSTSGTLTMNASATTATYTLTWPNAVAASNGYLLSSTTDGVLSWIAAPTTGITALTGDVTASGSGSVVATLAATSNGTLTTLSALTTATSLSSVGTISTGTWTATAIDPTHGGTGQTTYATGDTLYASASNVLSKLTIGSTGNVLTVSGGIPVWAPPATSGTVTSVSVVTANGLAGTVATATSTPAITLSTTVTGILQGNGTAISAATTTGTGSTVVLAGNPTLAGATLSAAINMGSNQINSLANGVASSDAVTLGQVQALLNGLFWKGPVQAYANSNFALTGGATLTIDNYSVQNGDNVILGNQTIASQNYVYVASGIGTAYVLTLVTGSEAPTAIGDAYLIEKGTVYGNSAFQVNAISPNVTFIQFAGPNTLTFTSPLLLTGNTVTIGYDNATIGVTSNQLSVLNGGIGTTQLANSSVTYAKIQNVTASTLLGNPTGSSTAPSEITLGSTLAFSGASLQTGALTGDVTTSANSFVTTIAAGAVTATKLGTVTDGITTDQNGSGSTIEVLNAPALKQILVAGQSFSANTTYAVRWGVTANSETANQVYAADITTSSFDLFYVIGLASSGSAVSAGQNITVTKNGPITLMSGDTTFAGTAAGNDGKAVFLTATGTFSLTAPSTSGQAITRVGILKVGSATATSNIIDVSPQTIGVN
jgi:trimeric autotransporter adhesin